MINLWVEFYVCGSLKLLEDMVFMFICYEGEVSGILMVICFVSGNCGGLRLWIFGFEGGFEWDME